MKLSFKQKGNSLSQAAKCINIKLRQTLRRIEEQGEKYARGWKEGRE